MAQSKKHQHDYRVPAGTSVKVANDLDIENIPEHPAHKGGKGKGNTKATKVRDTRRWE